MNPVNATHNKEAHHSKAILNFCCGAVIKITSPADNVHLHRKIWHLSQNASNIFNVCHNLILQALSLTSRGDLYPFRECSDPGWFTRSFPPQWKWNCRTVYLCFRPPPLTPIAPSFSSHSTAGIACRRTRIRRAGVFTYVHTVGFIPDSTPVCPLFFSIFMVWGRLKLIRSTDPSSWFLTTFWVSMLIGDCLRPLHLG